MKVLQKYLKYKLCRQDIYKSLQNNYSNGQNEKKINQQVLLNILQLLVTKIFPKKPEEKPPEPPPNTMKIVLIRHGESEWNKDNLFCGWYDAALSKKGETDALKVSAAELIKHNMQFDCAFTSALQRAQQSLHIILKQLNCSDIPINVRWQLNERHYGALTGANKCSTAMFYGKEQVQIWRRSYDVAPPPITLENPYYCAIRHNPSFEDVPDTEFPFTESLKMAMQRIIPVWENEICEAIASKKRVLVVAHGTTLRGFIKYFEGISDENIACVNIPNSIPCVYEFDLATRKPVGKVEYLADENFLKTEMEKTASVDGCQIKSK